MISGATLRLVLLVSCAHAMVHCYEIALPSVEQQIADQYHPDDAREGRIMTGKLSNYWRLPLGFGALAAGWLVDRFGAKRMLAIYLLGCGGACLVASLTLPMPMLFITMFAMGTFACIYHPAGLALISHNTTAVDRPRALGLHGIFGSGGIALAPFVAGIALAAGLSWQQYFWVLAVPGILLGVVFVIQAIRDPSDVAPAAQLAAGDVADTADWRSFYTLAVLAALQGFVYSGVLSFLSRYISGWRAGSSELEQLSGGSYLTAMVLLLGCIGQYTAGRIARPALLERQLTFVTLANVPFLLWMAVAAGWDRVLAAGMFSMVFFMHQPLYNSLIAKYTPSRRRSLCYGFSFAMGLGVGSFGARFAGYSPTDTTTYGVLAVVATVAAGLGLVLCLWNPASLAPEPS